MGQGEPPLSIGITRVQAYQQALPLVLYIPCIVVEITRDCCAAGQGGVSASIRCRGGYVLSSPCE